MASDADKWLAEYHLPQKFIDMLTTSEELTPKEIAEIISKFMEEWFPEYIKKILGVSIEIIPEETEEFRSLMKSVLTEIFESIKEVSKLPPGNEPQAIELISKPYLKLINKIHEKDGKVYTSLFEYLEEIQKVHLFPDFEGHYLGNTKYYQYRKAIYDLVDFTLSNPELAKLLQRIIESKEYGESGFFLQRRYQILIEDIEYLNRDFKRFTAPTMYNLAKIYYRLSEIYSKLIMPVRILHRAMNGRLNIEIDKAYREQLTNCVREIRKDSDLGILGDINTTIRNAGSHESYEYDTTQRSIIFLDRNGESEILRPEGLLEKTRQLSGLVFALINMLNYIEYKKIVGIRQHFESDNENF